MTMPVGNGGQGNALPVPLILVVVSLFVLMAFEPARRSATAGRLPN